MTLTTEEKQTLIKYKIEKAEASIKDVEFLIENGKYNLAISRIYYGVFYALTAVGLKYGFSTGKHQQLIGWFNKTFIMPGTFDKKYGSFIHQSYDKRSSSDYDDYRVFQKEETIELVSELKEFVESVKSFLFQAKQS